MNSLEQLFKIEPDYTKTLNLSDFIHPTLNKVSDEIQIINNVLSIEDCKQIIELFEKQGNYQSVSVQGMTDGQYNNKKGSDRITGFCPEIATNFYNRIKRLLNESFICNRFTSTDWWQQSDGSYEGHTDWKMVGLSPMLRFMKYEKYGKHYAHYDTCFLYPGGTHRTLKSFVLYLTTNYTGSIRFIKDNQSHIPTHLRNHNDWNRETLPNEVYFETLPVAGNMLIFDHKICHDVDEFLGNEERIIIRGDVLFEKF